MNYFNFKKIILLVIAASFTITLSVAQNQSPSITGAKKINSTTITLSLNNDRHILVDFYGENIFRLFEDSVGKQLREPYANPDASILVGDPKSSVGFVALNKTDSAVIISTAKVEISFDKSTSLFTIKNLQTNKIVAEEIGPVKFELGTTILLLKEQPSEYYYGGGVQNGRFSHKGKAIQIVNENSWTDGGVSSPAPFYWSTDGYGLMWYTFKPGKYDFGTKQKGEIQLEHETNYLDVFFMVSDTPAGLLNDYYQLTGHPILLPKFAFYEGHLNQYNRDYFKEDPKGVLFEDGKRYIENQKDNGGIKESLNGEKNNYQFSAKAVIDRYKRNNMPLGWILPNDGYGAGYGQTSTLDSNIMNLTSFGNYARQHGVQVGLWTQSDLYPKPGVKALLQRNIVKEVDEAGVRVLKTDVAWVGDGYSFGLNGIADVADITTKYGHNARPFIITLDGWAGTQRYAAVWTGDQTGGQWEYIRFHIPTYIGAGLSGEPNIASDMDGIFGGENLPVNVRDYEWRTFTPMQLNMDGWGANPKYPQALGEPATSINRDYLKLKSELIPYTYSIAREAVDGLPIVRAMFLEYPNNFTYGTATQYQFMYGPYFLIAPIYQDTREDKEGNDIRNNIYLPQGKWIDYFTGEQYDGNRVINYFNAPLWKLPVFVKPGAIIPMNNQNNNVTEINKKLRIYELYPSGNSSFTEYNDDGTTIDYKKGEGITTKISSVLNSKNIATITISPTQGNFNGFVKEKLTLLKFNVSQEPKMVTAKIGERKVELHKVKSGEEFKNKDNVYYYDAAPDFNQFATKDSAFSKVKIIRNPELLVELAQTDITKNSIEVQVSGYVFDIPNDFKKTTGSLSKPTNATVADNNITSYSLKPSWNAVANADYYDIEFNNMLYTHIRDTNFLFDGLQDETPYSFQVRAVNKSGESPWVTITAKTKINPLQFAIHNIAGYCTAPAEEGQELYHLFDMDSTDLWHTEYEKKATPFDLIMDLRSVNQLDKILYLPRKNGRNGIITGAAIYYSLDKLKWVEADNVHWARNNETKGFVFRDHPTARYIKLHVINGMGGYGSGRELYVLRVPGSSSYLPGDINNDGKIDNNDLTSYANYIGLRKGDADFEGYISRGDINHNNLIDAYDISNVATQLDGGVKIDSVQRLSGIISISADKKHYKKGETIEIMVKGENLNDVNALSFALPYNQEDYEYTGVQTLNMKQMENFTYDRLHTDGKKALYPTFANVGNKPALNGNEDLFILKFKARRNLTFDLKPIDGLLVSKDLQELSF